MKPRCEPSWWKRAAPFFWKKQQYWNKQTALKFRSWGADCMSIRTRTAALLLFGSGFCALVYQTAWLREFRLIFGASTAATAAVLGVFMAGLGFGGILFGRILEKRAKPLAFYAWLELFIALTAAISPLLILYARKVYIDVGG